MEFNEVISGGVKVESIEVAGCKAAERGFLIRLRSKELHVAPAITLEILLVLGVDCFHLPLCARSTEEGFLEEISKAVQHIIKGLI